MFPHCGRRIMVITRASQARDAGSIPVARSIAISNVAIGGVFYLRGMQNGRAGP